MFWLNRLGDTEVRRSEKECSASIGCRQKGQSFDQQLCLIIYQREIETYSFLINLEGIVACLKDSKILILDREPGSVSTLCRSTNQTSELNRSWLTECSVLYLSYFSIVLYFSAYEQHVLGGLRLVGYLLFLWLTTPTHFSSSWRSSLQSPCPPVSRQCKVSMALQGSQCVCVGGRASAIVKLRTPKTWKLR